jgi:hypothetical protein
MAATERVVVPMPPADAAALDARTATADPISAGEFSRRAIDAHDEPIQAEAAELKRLLSLLATTHAETLRQVDQTERKLDDALAYLANLGRARSMTNGNATRRLREDR